MRIRSRTRLLGAALALAGFVTASALPWSAAAAGTAPAPKAGDPAPAPQSSESPEASPAPQPDAGAQPPPGVPSDGSVMTIELKPRPVAYLSGSGEWATGFKAVRGEIAKVQAAITKAGLTAAGHPFALLLETGEKNFQFQAMVPIAENPEVKELSDGVKIGESPSGKALKFLHRGAYDDIDSTYELITAFLDEKGLDTENRFIEEYLTDTDEPDDANLEADIYVLLK
ncbi:MAG TPA: GyrI-like domain-containing protein [Methylocella sp.]|nr:GyrI-like domain-containing protein [Methylocella sp.]